MSRLKNQSLAKLTTRFPELGRVLLDKFSFIDNDNIPWSPVKKDLESSKVAIVTTSGVHHTSDTPFDMKDPDGDASYRTIKGSDSISDLTITHDYYDHTDADRDINIVFPLQRLSEFANQGCIGAVANNHYGFMGHITGANIEALMQETAPEIARKLVAEGVDLVLLTPG